MNLLHKLVAGMLLMAFVTVTASEEAVNKDLNVLGIFDQIRLQETKTISASGFEPRPVLRAKLVGNQSPTSFLTSVSLAEPEEADSIQPPYQPVNLNPFADNKVFKSLRNMLNSSGGPSCATSTFTGPEKLGSSVIMNFSADRCNTNNGLEGEWRLFLKLVSPGGGKVEKILKGKAYKAVEINFTTAETELSLGHESGSWVARVNLSVKLSGHWWNTFVQRHYAKISL